jgi:hypothetical protein
VCRPPPLNRLDVNTFLADMIVVRVIESARTRTADRSTAGRWCGLSIGLSSRIIARGGGSAGAPRRRPIMREVHDQQFFNRSSTNAAIASMSREAAVARHIHLASFYLV